MKLPSTGNDVTNPTLLLLIPLVSSPNLLQTAELFVRVIKASSVAIAKT